MSGSVKQNHHENDQETDRISNLPDALLCHILSFVCTKSAVATSILSRRWISLWTKVPVLDFSSLHDSMHSTGNKKKQCNSIIKKVLLHNDTPCLKRLHFEALQDTDTDGVNSMVNSLLKREIWEMRLHREWDLGRKNVPMQLPTSLFVRDRLVALKISGPFKINVPLSLHLPRLEKLNFYQVKFVGQDLLNIVTSGCPAIKELVIEYSSGIRMLYIDSLTLSRLRTTHICEMKVVKGPNIRFLDVQHATRKHEIGYLKSLVEFTTHVYPYQDITESWTLELIRRISCVQTLRLSCTAVELFGRVNENEVPMFPNLTCLEVQMGYSMFRMVQHAPKLMHIVVDVGLIDMSNPDFTPGPFPPEIAPHCLLSLRTFEIRNYGYYGKDMVARYVLKNATVLKEFKIHMHRATMECQRDAHKMLLSFPNISNCQVIVCSGCRQRNTF